MPKQEVLINFHFTCDGCSEDHLEIYNSFKKFEEGVKGIFQPTDSNNGSQKFEIGLISLPRTLPIYEYDNVCNECRDDENVN